MILEELITKMNISEKFKAINKKVEQNKEQYNLDRQTAEISTLSSEKYIWIFDRQSCLTRKRLAGKSCYNKKIWIFAVR